MEERYKCKIVVDLLLERENNGEKEILMLLRKNTGYFDGQYDLPGGHVDANEDLVDAMIREAKEEIGIDIERENLEIIHVFHNFKKDKVKFVLRAKSYDGEITIGEPDLCEELKWFKIRNIPENIVPTIKQEILNIKNGTFYSAD